MRPEERLKRLKAALAGPLENVAGPVAKAFGLQLISPEPLKVRMLALVSRLVKRRG